MNLYLVCYDIEDDRERTRVANYLVGRGERVQYSVFELCVRNGAALEEIKDDLKAFTGEEANIRFYRLTAEGIQHSFSLNGDAVGQRPAAVII